METRYSFLYKQALVGNIAHDSNAVDAIFTIQKLKKKDTDQLSLNIA